MVFVWLSIFLYFNFYRKSEDTIPASPGNRSSLSSFLKQKMRITTLVVVYLETLRKTLSLMNCIKLNDKSGLNALS